MCNLLIRYIYGNKPYHTRRVLISRVLHKSSFFNTIFLFTSIILENNTIIFLNNNKLIPNYISLFSISKCFTLRMSKNIQLLKWLIFYIVYLHNLHNVFTKYTKIVPKTTNYIMYTAQIYNIFIPQTYCIFVQFRVIYRFGSIFVYCVNALCKIRKYTIYKNQHFKSYIFRHSYSPFGKRWLLNEFYYGYCDCDYVHCYYLRTL